ncbi:MAG: redox-regulated ATPase YchF [Planctomycetota bacterium]|nr:redox-regulated ATPase YchF [Planctomycetota bacterium]
MEVGIVGLPGSGKTTLFNALTGSHAEAFSEKVHVGMADIPDPRLEAIAAQLPGRKLVHAAVRLVDIHGVPVGSDTKKLNQLLEQIRQVDAICHVVRCFDDGRGAIDPAGDIESMETELVLADLIVAESARDKALKPARAGEADAKARLAVLEKVIPALEDGRPIRAMSDITDTDEPVLRNYGFITAKPVLYVANIAENDLPGGREHAEIVQRHAESTGSRSVAVCAQLEAELSELEGSDHDEMLHSLGLEEPAVGPVARAALNVLGLGTFYTFNEKEIHAWAFPRGASAPEAAGVVHSDMQRGFIRAECYGVDDLIEHKTEKAIREAGKLRSEGKHSEMRDGDIVKFLFNV